jgi:hypothetical protein
MVKSMGISGGKKPDITSPAQLREQSRLMSIGRIQGRAKWSQILVVLAILLLFVTLSTFAIVKISYVMPGIQQNKYQAVFLDDGKVFFGDLVNRDGEYVMLENAYYTKSANAGSDDGSQTALIKVGSESYGPDNSLMISRSKIQFWQNLREDSQVSKAIEAKQ